MWDYLSELIFPYHLRRQHGRKIRVVIFSIVIGAVAVACMVLLLYTLYHRARP